MATDRIIVLARLRAKQDQLQEAKQQCMKLVEPTRHEPGCISYDLHQRQDDPSQLMFYEQWTSKGDLDAHMQKPHLQQFVAIADTILAEPLDVTIWNKLT